MIVINVDNLISIVDIMIDFTLSTSAFLCGGRIPWFLYVIGLSLAVTITSIFIPWMSDSDYDDIDD